MTRTTLTILAAFCTLLIAGVMIAQPSLNPPAGPVDTSDRFGSRTALNQANTPGDSEALFIIDKPGSYYLPANADAGSRDGIHIDAPDVTIDLNGFTLSGESGPESSSLGIGTRNPQAGATIFRGVTVRNGSIRGFGSAFSSNRINFNVNPPASSNLRNVLIEDLAISDVNSGIFASRQAVVASCRVSARGVGIGVTQGTVRDCSVIIEGDDDGVGTGISLNAAVARGCTVNISQELDRDSAAYRLLGSIAESCTATGRGTGFVMEIESLARGCISRMIDADASVTPDSIVVDSNF